MTTTRTKTVQRRYYAARRKFEKALRVFDTSPEFSHVDTYHEFKPAKDAVETTTYFFFKGEKYRFDYEIHLEPERPLPRVSEIRELMWLSLKEYRTGLWEPTLKRVV